jgi:hypothetical protein
MTDTELLRAIGIPIAFNAIGFALTNRRIDDMRDLWRAELRRGGKIFDARLTHIEERLGNGR